MKTTEQLAGTDYQHFSEPCHGGVGPWSFRSLLKGISETGFIKYIHDDLIPAGSSFGIHAHNSTDPEEEWYIILEGEGVMILDGVEHPIKAGDINVCRNGGSHGIKNTGNETMRVIVIYASSLQPKA